VPHGKDCPVSTDSYRKCCENCCGRIAEQARRVALALRAARWTTFNETWVLERDWDDRGPTVEEEAEIEEAAIAAALKALNDDTWVEDMS